MDPDATSYSSEGPEHVSSDCDENDGPMQQILPNNEETTLLYQGGAHNDMRSSENSENSPSVSSESNTDGEDDPPGTLPVEWNEDRSADEYSSAIVEADATMSGTGITDDVPQDSVDVLGCQPTAGDEDTEDDELSHNTHDSDDDEDDDDDDDEDSTMEQLTADLMEQYDPSRMQLTKEEHQWAMEIKKAIEQLPDLDGLSDFMYAQIALVTKGNVEEAVSRAYQMQEHKEENDIMDTLEDALNNLPKEASWLSIDYNLQTGGYIVAVDMTKVDAKIYSNPAQRQYYNRRSFYGGHMSMCDLAAIRAGGIVLAECEGYAVIKGKMIDLPAFRAIFAGLHVYPKKINQIKFFHCPMVFKVMQSLAKATLPKGISSKFQIVADCPLGNLNRLYSIPSPEAARAKMQQRMRGLIIKRYTNERNFSLEKQEP